MEKNAAANDNDTVRSHAMEDLYAEALRVGLSQEEAMAFVRSCQAEMRRIQVFYDLIVLPGGKDEDEKGVP